MLLCMNDCIFCKIAEGEIPSTKIYENEDTFAFLDLHPVNPGHALVIPKKHSTDIFTIEEEIWVAVQKTVRKVAHAIETALAPAGMNIHMNNRAPAGQLVFHTHVHLIPRRTDDGLEHWHGGTIKKEVENEIAAKIRAELNK